jgi:hypothetical protein
VGLPVGVGFAAKLADEAFGLSDLFAQLAAALGASSA